MKILNRKATYPKMSGGYYIITCSNCDFKFNAGRPGNNTGRRYCNFYAKKAFDEHKCMNIT